MIYFKAVCGQHNFESSLFRKKVDALRSANSHLKNVQGSHNIKVLEVYLPNESIQVRSEQEVS